MLLNISFHYDFYPILIIAAIAWFTPIALSVLKFKKVPSVIVELILGYFAGKYLFVNLSDESFVILDFLALLGFIFLMFLSGLEIDIDQIIASLPLKNLSRSVLIENPLIIGLTQFIFAIVLSYLGSLLLAQIIYVPSVWYISLIMITTSVAVVLPVLKNRGETSSQFGQMVIIAAAVADILSIVLFTFTAFIIKNGFHIKLLFIIVLFIFFFISFILINKLKNVQQLKKLRFQLSHAASQIRIRGTLLIIMIFVVLAHFIGEEAVLLGAFLSGLVLSSMLHRERSILMVKLDSIGYGFLIPFFFIMVGVRFDPHALLEFDQSLFGFLFLLLFFLFAIKVIPAFFWYRLFGFKKAMSGGFLMSSRLSLIIAASAIGLDLGVITPGINSSVIIMAIITCFISPIIFGWISPPDQTEGSKTIIIGGGSTAVLLARRLNLHGKKVVIVDNNKDRFEEIAKKGLNVVFGDGLNSSIYRQLKLTNDSYVIIETGNDATNIKISQLLRTEFQHKFIISRISRFSLKQKFDSLGVETVDVTQILATAIENLIVRPTTYHTLVESFENFSVDEILVSNSGIDGSKIKNVFLHKDAILIMIKRNNNFFIPHGDSYFKKGDILLVFGTQTALEDTQNRMS